MYFVGHHPWWSCSCCSCCSCCCFMQLPQLLLQPHEEQQHLFVLLWTDPQHIVIHLSQRKFQYCLLCIFFRGHSNLPSGSTGFHCHTSSKIFSAGSHTEHHWRLLLCFCCSSHSCCYLLHPHEEQQHLFFFWVALKWSQHITVLLKGSSSTAAVVYFFRGHSNVPLDPLDLTPVPDPKIFSAGSHTKHHRRCSYALLLLLWGWRLMHLIQDF